MKLHLELRQGIISNLEHLKRSNYSAKDMVKMAKDKNGENVPYVEMIVKKSVC